MKLSHVLSSAPVLGQAGAYLVTPDGTPAPGSSVYCSLWVQDSYALTCAIIEKFYGLTEALFEEWNPSTTLLGDSCTLISDLYYCVQINYSTMSTLSTSPPTSTTKSTSSSSATTTTSSSTIVTATSTTTSTTLKTSTTSTTSSTTSTGNGVATPTPYQSGMTTSCDTFHLVVSGDGCYDIAAAAGIALADFYTWNPAVGTTCASLWLGYYVCTGIIDTITTSTTATRTTTTSTTSTTTSSSAIATPTPYQSGMTTTCDTFHLVVSGDGCYDIAAAAGIALADFYTWNPDVGSTCASLWLGYYVCIGIK
ncbi:LysM domain-containing protein [Rhexocercosporidium sp. MPI-PUGE-AT-0058]|nr:LysM domain-containing protein [Rhexocercosporidium sp. MPI-PUGE-AT-0058]